MMPTAEAMRDKREEVKQRELKEKKEKEKSVREKELKVSQAEKEKADQITSAELANRQKQQQAQRLNAPSSRDLTSSPNTRGASSSVASPPNLSLDKK